MKIIRYFYASDFQKAIHKYPAQKKIIIKRIDIFLENPFNPILKTHKLKGKLKGFWSFSINYHLRILFQFVEEGTVGFFDIGTHEIYK